MMFLSVSRPMVTNNVHCISAVAIIIIRKKQCPSLLSARVCVWYVERAARSCTKLWRLKRRPRPRRRPALNRLGLHAGGRKLKPQRKQPTLTMRRAMTTEEEDADDYDEVLSEDKHNSRDTGSRTQLLKITHGKYFPVRIAFVSRGIHISGGPNKSLGAPNGLLGCLQTLPTALVYTSISLRPLQLYNDPQTPRRPPGASQSAGGPSAGL